MFGKLRELFEKYRVDECCPQTFIPNQQGIFINTDSDRGVVVIRPLSVGVSEKGLYLFQPFPYNILFPSLFIPWKDIEYQRPTEEVNRNNPHTFYLSNLQMTSLRLYPNTIQKLEESYGEPIFYKNLGEPN